MYTSGTLVTFLCQLIQHIHAIPELVVNIRSIYLFDSLSVCAALTMGRGICQYTYVQYIYMKQMPPQGADAACYYLAKGKSWNEEDL